MYVRNPYVRAAFRSLAVIFLLWGILLHFSCTDGDKTAHNFSFFTVQSNLLCLVSLLLFLRQDVHLLRLMQQGSQPIRQNHSPALFIAEKQYSSALLDAKKQPSSALLDTKKQPSSALLELKFAATLCILVTFLGNHAVVLLSRTFSGGILGLPMKSFLAHYAAPALVTLDWLFFTPKGRLHACSPLKWMLAPALYLLFTVLRALCCSEEVLARTGKYPYFFLNVDRVGARVYIYIGVYFACFLLLGYLIFFTDLILSKIHRHA